MSGKSQVCLPPLWTAVGAMSPPGAPVLSGVAQLRRWSQPKAAARLPHSPLPSSQVPMPVVASSPFALALRGWLPHHRVQQSAGWSSFQSCHFFFISDFTCHGSGDQKGLFPGRAFPADRAGEGWDGKATSRGRAEPQCRAEEAAVGTYLLIGEAVQHGHQEALDGEQGSETPPPPPLPGLGWA